MSKVILERKTKMFALTEPEAEATIAEVKEQTKGEIKRQEIIAKNHKDYGKYFEITFVEEFNTSKNVLEGGI